jgi:GH18 family chitinase
MRLLPFVLLTACVSERPEGWTPHADAVADAAMTAPPSYPVAPPPPLRSPGDRPDVTVYGYWPYWGDPLDTVQWDQMTHVALFDVSLESDGTLGNTSRWTNNAAEAMQLAAPWGVKIHLTVTCFSDSIMASVLPDPAKRATAIAQLRTLVDQFGAHGVNIDFEGMDAFLKDDLVAFTQELAAEVDEVYLATPAVDWLGAYDYDELAFASDGLFIMGYGYHWSGGNPGPVAPLDGGGVWGPRSLSWSVDDYRTWGTPDDKIVLGLPLYGRDWPSTDNSIPGTATASGSAAVYSTSKVTGPGFGALWDAQTSTSYAFPSSTRQLWYDDADSVEIKTQYAIDEGLQGFGFWALTYDDADPDLWQRIDAQTHFEDDGPVPTPFQPGRAGVINSLSFSGATPNADVTLVIGRGPGAPTVPGCSEQLAFGSPYVLGTMQADADGQGTLHLLVPMAARNRTVQLQAVELDACRVSDPVATSFQ